MTDRYIQQGNSPVYKPIAKSKVSTALDMLEAITTILRNLERPISESQITALKAYVSEMESFTQEKGNTQREVKLKVGQYVTVTIFEDSSEALAEAVCDELAKMRESDKPIAITNSLLKLMIDEFNVYRCDEIDTLKTVYRINVSGIVIDK